MEGLRIDAVRRTLRGGASRPFFMPAAQDGRAVAPIICAPPLPGLRP
jgi:hypothetical protein